MTNSLTAQAVPSPHSRRRILLGSERIGLLFDVRTVVAGGCFALAALVIGAVTLTTGDYHIALPDVVRTLFGGGSDATRFIVETLRLPRLLTALLVGAALGMGGALFQSLSRNPLGSPDIVGFDTGAATGALLVILVWHGSSPQVATGAVVGGVATAIVVYLLAIKRGVQGYRLILIGIGIASMLSSVNAYLITRANIADAQAAAVWLTGSLNGRGWDQVRPISLAVVVLAPVAMWLGRDLRMLEAGDDVARALGVRAEGSRLASVVVGVGLTAVATSSAGPIGFIALSAPQVARRVTKAPGPNVVPSALAGAALLAGSDLAAQRIFAPTQLPVGVMTGAIGGVYLAWLLSKEWRKGRG